LPSDPRNVLLISDELAPATPEPGSWLNTAFFKVEHIKFISLVSTNAANSWELARDTESSPWRLVDSKPGEVLDASLAAQVAEILAFPRFEDVVPRTAPLPASRNLDHPIVVTVLTEHLAYTLKVGAKGLDGNYPMTVAVAADIPAERVAVKDGPPEEKQALDKDFQDRTQQLRDKLAREQALAPWVYVVDSWIELVIRDRAQLLAKKTVASDQSVGR